MSESESGVSTPQAEQYRVVDRVEPEPPPKLPTFDIQCGDAKQLVSGLPVVQCVVTSPPYFHQRFYGDSGLEMGTEPDLEKYITSLCDLFDSIPLHPRGSIWINLGDKRNSSGGLMQVPSRFALAMADRQWQLIDSVVWAKVIDHVDGSTEGQCLPEPHASRLNGNGHEMLYRFTKSREPWADSCSIRIPRAGFPMERYLPPELMSVGTSTNGRNIHNVWQIPMACTRENHFAAYPDALCERPIAMTCPLYVNPDGSTPERVVKMVPYNGLGAGRPMGAHRKKDRYKAKRRDVGRPYIPTYPHTKGWATIDENWRPGVVLDPLCGTGTTGAVALKLGRSFIGIELYEDNCDIARRRCEEALLLRKRWQDRKLGNVCRTADLDGLFSGL